MKEDGGEVMKEMVDITPFIHAGEHAHTSIIRHSIEGKAVIDPKRFWIQNGYIDENDCASFSFKPHEILEGVCGF